MSPESNRPFVNSAISQSARSISSDSQRICSSHSPEGRVGTAPAPSLRLPLPHAPSTSLGALLTWSPGSTSSASASLTPDTAPPWPWLAGLITIAPWDHVTCPSRWPHHLSCSWGTAGREAVLPSWPAQGPSRYRSLGGPRKGGASCLVLSTHSLWAAHFQGSGGDGWFLSPKAPQESGLPLS